MKQKLYITTSIPYVNAAPHVGFALELVQTDVIARFNRLIGREVRFQTGTDENATKNVLAARQQGLGTAALVDTNAGRFRQLLASLDISADDFIRTTEDRHRRGVHQFWRQLRPGDVYRKAYHGLYCTGCEDFLLEKDLINGCCSDHGTPPLHVAEENYFFRLSAYQRQIDDLIQTGRVEVVPPKRRSEVLSFIRAGLQDISISRSAARTGGWGIHVPDDPSQTIYVWIDALINYLSGPGFGSGDGWREWWNDDVEKVHVIGKNVWKFHAVYWPALLLSAGLPLPDKIVVHGFVTANGRKIGKSLGNSIDPFECVERFGADTVRYYLLRSIPSFDDGDFSLARLAELYRTELVNGIGNLVSRLASLCAKAGYVSSLPTTRPAPPGTCKDAFAAFELDKALAQIYSIVDELNVDIERKRPWELVGKDHADSLLDLLAGWLAQMLTLATCLGPVLPSTSVGIIARLFSGPVRPASPLFPRR
jgi:methionyl-tRNA synthetase